MLEDVGGAQKDNTCWLEASTALRTGGSWDLLVFG